MRRRYRRIDRPSADVPVLTARPTPELSLPILPIATVVCAVLVVVGSFGPWATATIVLGSISVSGMDNTGDGILTLAAGIVAGLAVLPRIIRPRERIWVLLIALLGFASAAGVGLYHWRRIRNLIDVESISLDVEAVSLSVGWGLTVLTVAAIVGGVLCLIQGVFGESE